MKKFKEFLHEGVTEDALSHSKMANDHDDVISKHEEGSDKHTESLLHGNYLHSNAATTHLKASESHRKNLLAALSVGNTDSETVEAIDSAIASHDNDMKYHASMAGHHLRMHNINKS